MKIAILALFALAASAQTPPAHSVTLNWVNAKNPAGTVSNVYKAPSACSANPTNFVRIATGLTANTYLDSPVPIGAYCYYVTAVYAGMESAPSPTALAAVTPFAPENLTTLVSVVVSVTVAQGQQGQQGQATPQVQQAQPQQAPQASPPQQAQQPGPEE